MRIRVLTPDGVASEGRVRLRAGEIVLIDGRRFITGRVIAGTRKFTAFDNPDVSETLSLTAIEEMADAKRLLLEPRPQEMPRHVQEALQRALESYNEGELAYMDRALAYCKAADKLGPRLRLTKKGLAVVISDTAARLEDKKPWQWNSLRTLYLQWISSGRDPRSLLPGWSSQGNRDRKHDHWVHELAVDFLNRKWLVPERPTIAWLYPRFSKELEDEAKRLGVPTPKIGKNFLYRKAGEYEEYTILYHRYSPRDADVAVRNVGRGPQGDYAGETYEADHTPLNLVVRDPKSGLSMGRPYLTVVLDRYSRLIVGFCISFHPPSWMTVMLALKMALSEKKSWLSQFSGIDGPWPETGSPTGFVFDGGKEFQSSSKDTAILRIGAEMVKLPRRRPDLKGKVESFLDKLQMATIQNLPGTTFRNIEERGEYQPSKNAEFSVQGVQWIVTKYIVDGHNKRPHSGIMKRKPLDVWNESVQAVGRRPSVDPQLLSAFLGQSKQCKVDQRGIQLDHLFYNSKQLAQVRNQCAKRGARSSPDRFTVLLWASRDLCNFGAIDVLDPTSNRWFKVPCTWPEYAEGLTDRQHALVMNQYNARERDKLTQEDLKRTFNALHDEVDAVKAGEKRSGQMKHIARFEDTGPRPQDVIEPSQVDAAASAATISKSVGDRTTRVTRPKAGPKRYGPEVRIDVDQAPPIQPQPQSNASAGSADSVSANPTKSVDETAAVNSIARQARSKAFSALKDL